MAVRLELFHWDLGALGEEKNVPILVSPRDWWYAGIGELCKEQQIGLRNEGERV